MGKTEHEVIKEQMDLMYEAETLGFNVLMSGASGLSAEGAKAGIADDRAGRDRARYRGRWRAGHARRARCDRPPEPGKTRIARGSRAILDVGQPPNA